MPQVQVTGLDQNGNTFGNQQKQVDKLPDECPVCGVTIIPQVLLQGFVAIDVSGDKLPVVSRRAAWLGNDETHYERRWVGKDLVDLKKLIAAVEHFIAMEVLVKELPAEMPDPA